MRILHASLLETPQSKCYFDWVGNTSQTLWERKRPGTFEKEKVKMKKGEKPLERKERCGGRRKTDRQEGRKRERERQKGRKSQRESQPGNQERWRGRIRSREEGRESDWQAASDEWLMTMNKNFKLTGHFIATYFNWAVERLNHLKSLSCVVVCLWTMCVCSTLFY